MRLTFMYLLLVSLTTFATQIPVLPNVRQAISAALVKAKPGDTLLISAGTYKENVIVSNGVTLKAMQPLTVTIKGNGRGSVVTLSSESHIDGIIIKNGNHGISANFSSSTIANCLITSNRASGVFSLSQFPEITNTVISFNTNGIRATSILNTITLNNVTITNNMLHGLSLDQSRAVIIKNSLFYKNEILHISAPLDNIEFVNSILYPAQKELSGPEIIIQEPLFNKDKEYRQFFLLSNQSPGIGSTADGSNIGATLPR